jgi:hypothetical protein
MGFRRGTTGRFQVRFRVKAKKSSTTLVARTKELNNFVADLKRLAKKYGGIRIIKLPKAPRIKSIT